MWGARKKLIRYAKSKQFRRETARSQKKLAALMQIDENLALRAMRRSKLPKDLNMTNYTAEDVRPELSDI